ncbi:hypothetical protein F4825DRAFT_33834 [Nemania diffusa]|nr:hypothetical protein F4825DRAFT_33834 [Nemania diffusa]
MADTQAFPHLTSTWTSFLNGTIATTTPLTAISAFLDLPPSSPLLKSAPTEISSSLTPSISASWLSASSISPCLTTPTPSPTSLLETDLRSLPVSATLFPLIGVSASNQPFISLSISSPYSATSGNIPPLVIPPTTPSPPLPTTPTSPRNQATTRPTQASLSQTPSSPPPPTPSVPTPRPKGTPLPPAPPSGEGRSSSSARPALVIAAIVVSVVVFLVILAIALGQLKRRRRRGSPQIEAALDSANSFAGGSYPPVAAYQSAHRGVVRVVADERPGEGRGMGGMALWHGGRHACEDRRPGASDGGLGAVGTGRWSAGSLQGNDWVAGYSEIGKAY